MPPALWLAAALAWSAGTVAVGRTIYRPWAARIMARGEPPAGSGQLSSSAQYVWAGITSTFGALLLLPLAALIVLVMRQPTSQPPQPSTENLLAEIAELDRAIAAARNSQPPEETTP